MRETAFAKLNLALHVRARGPDGYHRIETIFAFCEDGDLLTAEHRQNDDEYALRITGLFAAALGDPYDEQPNIVERAVRALREHCGRLPGVALNLEKRLPVAAGLGGGSADAAATLRLLARLFELELPNETWHRLAAKLGADVPACLASRTARGEGRGDVLMPIELGLTGMAVLLVNPGVSLSTRAVFSAWDGIDRGTLGDWREGRNDLEEPACALVPEIDAALDALAGASFVRMSGSGATCFGLYSSEAARDEARERISADHPSWWTFATRLK